MPRANIAETPIAMDEESIEIRVAELADYSCTFEKHKTDSDPAPLFVGLPDDRCQCTHLGYVIKGKLVFQYADHDETVEAGETYVATPGHLPLLFAGTELVEFTKTSELGETVAVITKNLESMKAGV
ncbi:MAG: cupin domain-containing protein [Actinomycetota bacterium]|nr:cupin domain-containing protein [Actinomycetota bacterium]